MSFHILYIEPASDSIFIYLISAILSLIIFYHIIKAAVKNGMIEAQARMKQTSASVNYRVEKKPTSAQERLQARYNKGEMTFEQFKTEWEQLDKV